jgi:CDP-glucose 4,6-dehydratase
MLGRRLFEGNRAFAEAWNFGPSEDDVLSVRELLEQLKAQWDGLDYVVDAQSEQFHETRLLRLDSSKSKQRLKWRPVWNCSRALEKTASWYQAFYESGTVSSGQDLAAYVEAAHAKGLEWAK